MAGINGITITLYERVPNGVDDFNHVTYAETMVDIPDVIVSPVSSTEVLETFNLTGWKRAPLAKAFLRKAIFGHDA